MVIDVQFTAENLATLFLSRYNTGNTKKGGFILWEQYKPAGAYAYNGKLSANATTAPVEIVMVCGMSQDTSNFQIHM